MSGDLSSSESSRFVFLVRPLFELAGIADEQVMTFAIRKTAHFSEYAVLCALAWKMACTWYVRKTGVWRTVLTIWVLAPSIDETIQRFVPGRAGQLRDVCIDMAGGAVGLILMLLFEHRQKKRRTGP